MTQTLLEDLHGLHQVVLNGMGRYIQLICNVFITKALLFIKSVDDLLLRRQLLNGSLQGAADLPVSNQLFRYIVLILPLVGGPDHYFFLVLLLFKVLNSLVKCAGIQVGLNVFNIPETGATDPYTHIYFLRHFFRAKGGFNKMQGYRKGSGAELPVQGFKSLGVTICYTAKEYGVIIYITYGQLSTIINGKGTPSGQSNI